MTASTLTITHRSVFEYLSEQPFEGRVTRNILGCASKFLEYLYSWTKWKFSTHRTEWFYQPLRRISDDLIEYGIDSVRKAIRFLVEIGAIGRRINPRSYQDKVYQYRFLLSHKVMDALHAIDKARQGKDLELAEQLVKTSLAESLESGSGIRLTAKISEAVDFVIAFSKPETQSPKPEIRSSGSDFQQHRNKQTNIHPESSKPFSTPLPPKAAEPEEEEREEEVLEAEVVETEDATPTQQPRTTPEPEPRQEIQLWRGIQGSEGVLNSNSTKHPALVFSGEDTPWLEQPSRRNARLGRPQWNQAFLEWGGARFAQKFGKADRFEAMGDFRVALENNPDKILARWEEYEGVMGATLQNVADRAAASVTLDDKDRAKLEKHHRAVANTQIHIPVPQPVLAEVAEVAHDRRVAEVDWDRVGREADEAIAVEVEPVAESVAPLPVTETEPEPEYSTPSQFRQMMGNLMKSFGNRSLGGKPKPVESEPVESGTPAPSGDTDLVARAIATNDPILLNDPYVKKQLLSQEVLGLVSLEKEGNRIVSVEDRF